MTMNAKLGWVLGIVIACFGLFVMTDCSLGRWRFQEDTVQDKQFHAAWTEQETYTDSDGHLHFTTIHHPAQYKLRLSDLGWVDVTSGLYESTTNGQVVTSKWREGRITGHRYLRTAQH